MYLKTLITSVMIFLVSLIVMPGNARAVNFGERSDYWYWWEHESTWPYGSEDFVAAAKFKGGDSRVVFAGVNGNVAIYDSNANSWLAIGKWPHSYYRIRSVGVRDGNASIVFGGEWGRYAVLEHSGGSWRWVKSGTWPPGDRYYSGDDSYSNTILAVADKPYASDNTVAMGGVNGDVALLDASNNFIGNFKWSYYGYGGRGPITNIIAASENRLLLLGRNGGNWYGNAVQYLNSNNTLGDGRTIGNDLGDGIAKATTKDGQTAWFLTNLRHLGYVKVNNINDGNTLTYVGLDNSCNALDAWSNGSVFIGGDYAFRVYRYDGKWGYYNGWAPVKIRWVETCSDGRVYIAGEGKIYHGVSWPPFSDQPLLKSDYPPAKYYGSIRKRMPWSAWTPIRVTLAQFTIPEGGIARSITFRNYVYYTEPNYGYTGNFKLRIWGYQASGSTYEINKVLIAEFNRDLASGKAVDETLSVDFYTGVTNVEVSFEIDSTPSLDDSGRFDIAFEVKECKYQVFQPRSVSIRQVENGNFISWRNQNYPWPHSVSYQYALRRDGNWIMDWTDYTCNSFLDTSAVKGQSYKYELLTRYKNSSTAHSYAIDDQALLVADAVNNTWNTTFGKSAATLAGEAAAGSWYDGQSAAYWAKLAAQNAAPVISKVQGTNGATCTTGSSFTLVISAVPSSGVSYRVTCGSFDSGWVTNNTITISSGIVSGANTATVQVKNAAGNTAQTTFTFFKV